jgi:hypothetical protein
MSDTNLLKLLERCVEPIEDRLYDLINERAKYEGYPVRQGRFDRLIDEDRVLLAAVRAALSASDTL